MRVCNSQRTQTAGCCQDTGTQSWRSPASSDGRRRWGTPCTHPGWTPGSFLEAPRKNCTTKRVKASHLLPGSQIHLHSYSQTCCRWACHRRAGCFPATLLGCWNRQAWNTTGRSGCRCRGSSFRQRTGYTPGPTSPGTPRPYMRKLGEHREEKMKMVLHNLVFTLSYNTVWHRLRTEQTCKSRRLHLVYYVPSHEGT